jgi:chitin synthase
VAYVVLFPPVHIAPSVFRVYFTDLRILQHVDPLQVAVSNIRHDVSWGTKGDNVIHTELGAAVSAGKGEKGDFVEVEVPSEQLDIDSGYDDALANLRERRPIPDEAVNESTLKEDYYREIRTRLVLIWIVSNATLAMALTEVYTTGISETNGYLKCE